MPPVDSATVVLLREGEPGRFELLLMRRNREQSFMGGACVFPGGQLDHDDCDSELASYGSGLWGEAAKKKLQEDIAPELALGLFFCVVRELFEEAGVLLAYDAAGKLVKFIDADTAARFAGYRAELHKGWLSLKDLAIRENITYALDRLIPYSHWITPEIEAKRFNTRFFLAPLPEGQLAAHDRAELVSSTWLSPAAALEEHRAGKITLMPPTLKTVLELSGYESIAALCAAAAKKVIPPILPQAFPVEGGFGVMLPHDPDYAIAGYKQEPRPGEVSRIIMKDGRWRAQTKDRGSS